MRNFFDTQSLSRYFSVQNSQQRLALVGNNVAQGNPLFERLLLNDEEMRERAKTIKDGVELHRENMSSLISKIQTLQARLQAIYQSMMDRYLMTSSARVATPQDQTDPWAVSQWKSVGRAPLLFSRGANADEELDDPLGAGPNNLARLHYKRPVDAGGGNWNMYQERGSYYTTLAYLWDWDLHQLRYTYATGTDPYNPGNISNDKVLEVTAVDFNKIPPRNWKAGDLITLDPNLVFTPEFLSSGLGNGDIRYQNGSGYQFGGNMVLYAYVREVEYLPDGITKPVTIDIVKSKDLTDANNDGIPDDTVKLVDFLTAIGNESYSLRLSGADYAGSSTDLVGASGPGPNTNGWSATLYQNNTTYWNHGIMGTDPNKSPVETIWAGSTHQEWNLWTKDMTLNTSDIDILKHPTLEYDNFVQIFNDDDGTLFVSRSRASWLSAVGDTYDQDSNIFDWVRLGRDAGGGATLWDGTNIRALESMWLEKGENLSFYYRASSHFYSGSTTNAGVAIVGDLNVRTIAGQDIEDRYYVDRFGNIYDKYGTGNASADDYDYIPDVDANAMANYVGNIFGANTRTARTKNLDGNKGGTVNGKLDHVEATPWLSIAQRNYNTVDENTLTPATGSSTNLSGSHGVAMNTTYQDPGETGISTYNPQFGGIYLGFAERDYTTIGKAGVVLDAWGRSTNTIKFRAIRTGLSSGYGLSSDNNTLLDRNYNAIAPGTTVRILDHQGNQVAFATISGLGADGQYTVSNMRDAASGGNAVILDPNKTYTITTDVDPGARLGGSMENQLAVVLQNTLKSNEYREAIKYGLLDDLIISATAVTPFGDQLAGRITISYNKRQERVEIYQNAFSAFYKSTQT